MMANGRVTRNILSNSSKKSAASSDALATKSFYSKRAQSQSPLGHLRKRRKVTTDNDENVDLSGISGNESSGYDFHSSDSGGSERGRSVLRQKNMKQTKHRKCSLEVVTVKSKRAVNSSKIASKTSVSTKKVGEEIEKTDVVKSTPVSNKKKFFKTRSPASADRCFGNIVIRKGFDVKFYPKRQNIGESTKKAKKTEVKMKPKLVKTVSAKNVIPTYECEFWKTDGTDDEKLNTVEDSDSGLCISSDHTESNSKSPVETESPVLFEHEKINSDSDSVSTETLSLIGAGSDDLFSNCGRNTPKHGHSESMSQSQIQAETTPVHAINDSSSGSEKSKLSNTSCEETLSQIKFFPIFTKGRDKAKSSQESLSRSKVSPGVSRSLSSSLNNSPLLKYVKSKDGLEQMMIDAGQKRFGATRCDTCGMVYTMSEPADEAEHLKFHLSLLNALKFPGWKKERVVQEYVDTGSRIIMVTDDDPKYAIKKVEDINRIMGQELGFPEPELSFRRFYKAFLYISEDKKIQGCCVSEPVQEGYRVLPEDTNESQNHPGRRPWCCSDTPEAAAIGISRIWVYSLARKKGIATKLLDCVRQRSIYGTVIPKRKMAFSDPTPDGKRLASSYCGTPSFLVYKFQ